MFSRAILLAAVTMFAAAAEEAAAPAVLPPPVARDISFVNDIHPILVENCYRCHGGDRQRGGLQLNSLEALLEGGENGPVVVAGDSESSRLIQLVAGMEEGLLMPPSGARLTLEQIGVLRAWIDQGLAWDMEASAEGGAMALAPRRPEPPAREGLDNPVDQFVWAYFAEHGIEPPPPVDDRAFARRASLDVTGLPPATEALAALEDNNPAKRAAFVDALLADNQGYAENWITLWNDALRNDFKGTGYIDGGRKQITSWLYTALYDNLPYDQFVTQLVNPSSGSEGFVNGIIWRGVVNASQLPPVQAAQNVSQVFMGVNIKCASCHDSFVNQWTLKDAYGMAAVFASEPLELVRCDVPQGEMAEAKFLWPELGTIDTNADVRLRRGQLARLITHEDNGRFTRTQVNRLWAILFGRGIIEPLADLDSAPWNRDLLDWLASDFADHGYDVRHTLRQILNSKTYQLATDDLFDPDKAYVFRGPLPRRLSAEQFLDGLSSVTGAWHVEPLFGLPAEAEKYQGKVRAWRIAADPLTRALGRPNREQVVLRRDYLPTTLQAVELSNGETFDAFLTRGANKLLEEAFPTTLDLITAIYQRALLRPPAEAELAAARALVPDDPTPESVADLLWAMALLPDFQYIK